MVEDTGWFFDTEMLVLAERAGLRIHEVPVDWVDDPDSRVDIVSTAMADLRGIARLLRGLGTGRLPLAKLGEQLGRNPLPAPAGLTGQLLRFAAVGTASTLAYLMLSAAFLLSNAAAGRLTGAAAHPAPSRRGAGGGSVRPARRWRRGR